MRTQYHHLHVKDEDLTWVLVGNEEENCKKQNVLSKLISLKYQQCTELVLCWYSGDRLGSYLWKLFTEVSTLYLSKSHNDFEIDLLHYNHKISPRLT